MPDVVFLGGDAPLYILFLRKAFVTKEDGVGGFRWRNHYFEEHELIRVTDVAKPAPKIRQAKKNWAVNTDQLDTQPIPPRDDLDVLKDQSSQIFGGFMHTPFFDETQRESDPIPTGDLADIQTDDELEHAAQPSDESRIAPLVLDRVPAENVGGKQRYN